MVKKIPLFIFLISLFSVNAYSAPEIIVLNQKKVANLLLTQGFQSRETIYKYDLENIRLSEYLGKFDWGVSLEVGQTEERTQDFQTLDNTNKIQTLSTILGLQKKIQTGTSLTFQARRASRRASYSPGSSQFLNSGDATSDLLGVKIEQELLYNAFGKSDRADYRAIKWDVESTQYLRTDELQNKVLDAVRLFWNTYVAQENFKESLAARDRYEKLVQFIRRKSSLGYARPGELAQIQAELESKIQNVKTRSTDYLTKMDQLLTMLNLPRSSEVQFEITQQLPPPPQLSPKTSDENRLVKAQKLKVKSKEESLRGAEGQSWPRVALVGEMNQTGYDRDSSSSLAEATSGSNPKYYVGLKLEYTFGSGQQTETILNRKLSKLLEETKLERQQREIADNLEQTERNVLSKFQSAESASKQKEFSDRYVKEMTTTYNQGRTELKIYVDALNLFFQSQVNFSRAIGDYQIALNEWAAARDELIPNDTAESESQ